MCLSVSFETWSKHVNASGVWGIERKRGPFIISCGNSFVKAGNPTTFKTSRKKVENRCRQSRMGLTHCGLACSTPTETESVWTGRNRALMTRSLPAKFPHSRGRTWSCHALSAHCEILHVCCGRNPSPSQAHARCKCPCDVEISISCYKMNSKCYGNQPYACQIQTVHQKGWVEVFRNSPHTVKHHLSAMPMCVCVCSVSAAVDALMKKLFMSFKLFLNGEELSVACSVKVPLRR